MPGQKTIEAAQSDEDQQNWPQLPSETPECDVTEPVLEEERDPDENQYEPGDQGTFARLRVHR